MSLIKGKNLLFLLELQTGKNREDEYLRSVFAWRGHEGP